MTPSRPQLKGSIPLILFGVPLHNLTFASTLERIDELIATEHSKLVATANLDFHRVAAEDPEMQRILFDADIMMADGHPIVKLSPFFGPRLKERVTGSDITPMLAEHAAKKGHRLFFLGAAPGVAQQAADILTKRHPGLNVVGCYSPDKADVISMKSDVILQKLEETKPDVMLVAFGAPKQEKWIQMHRGEWKVPVSMGIGGSLDFIAGAQMRSPVWMQKLGLEWLGRMLANPKRLAGRYLQDGLFLLRAIIRLLAIRLSPRGKLAVRLDQTPEGKNLSGLNSIYAVMKSVKTLEEGELEAARLLELAAGKNLVVMPESVAWLTSVELGILVYLAGRLRKKNRTMLVYATSRRIERLLYAQGLKRCFPIANKPSGIIRKLERRTAESTTGSVERDDANMLTVHLPAELTAVNREALATLLFKTWQEGAAPSKIRVDASPMRYIDSAGLSLLVDLKKRAEEELITVSFAGCSEVVKQIIHVNNLNDLIGK